MTYFRNIIQLQWLFVKHVVFTEALSIVYFLYVYEASNYGVVPVAKCLLNSVTAILLIIYRMGQQNINNCEKQAIFDSALALLYFKLRH